MAPSTAARPPRAAALALPPGRLAVSPAPLVVAALALVCLLLWSALLHAGTPTSGGWRAAGASQPTSDVIQASYTAPVASVPAQTAPPLNWKAPRQPAAPALLPANASARPLAAIAPPAAQPSAPSAVQPVAAEAPTVIRLEAVADDPFEDPFGDGPQQPLLDQPQLFPTAQAQPPAEPSPSSQPPRRMPDFEQSLVLGPQGEQPCIKPSDLKPITAITNQITAEPGEFPRECPLEDEQFQPRNWATLTYTWKASGLCHKPLYFEEVALERYGHTTGPITQPLISGAHFFATVPLLPYKMGVEPPWECAYPLGYYRPGDCAPYMLYPFPISMRGALLQAATVTGLVFVIP